MKYAVIIPDGAADYKCEGLGGKTPLDVAKKPCLDSLASRALCGTVSNVPSDMVPESDTANLAILSYDPKIYSKGRSPLEAVSMGIEMKPDETAFRCNVVTLDGDPAGGYDNLRLIDHSADEISTPEAAELIKAVEAELGRDGLTFYPGVSYRHCLIWRDAPDFCNFSRPHDIIGQCIADKLPPEPFVSMYRSSYEILKDHPVNLARIERGLKPANSIWLWSPGKEPALPDFKEKWGVSGSVISAVDLLKGIGLCAGMIPVNVEGATGNIHTNFKGKAQVAIDEFKRGQDFVYIHVEAPDECGHRAELENKVRSIELIDEKVICPIYEYLRSTGEDFKILVLPDHPTPICRRTHTGEPVPFMLYSSADEREGVASFNEDNCEAAGFYVEHGYTLLSHMIEK